MTSDTSNGSTRKIDKLNNAAQIAKQIRDASTQADVVALRVEKVRFWCNFLIWTGIIMGLGFTTVNVHEFVSAGATRTDVVWWSSWMYEPMVVLPAIGVLLARQILSRYNVDDHGWVRVSTWLALASTYAMNTWSSWDALFAGTGGFAPVVKHSIPVIIVFVFSEAGPAMRNKLTSAVGNAHAEAETRRREAFERAQAYADFEAVTVDGQTVPELTAPADRPLTTGQTDVATGHGQNGQTTVLTGGQNGGQNGVQTAWSDEPVTVNWSESSDGHGQTGRSNDQIDHGQTDGHATVNHPTVDRLVTELTTDRPETDRSTFDHGHGQNGQTETSDRGRQPVKPAAGQASTGSGRVTVEVVENRVRAQYDRQRDGDLTTGVVLRLGGGGKGTALKVLARLKQDPQFMALTPAGQS